MVTQVGDRFGGRYELGELLGSGGTGSVRRARDTVLDRPVAIKLLRTESVDDVNRARLRAEAQLAGQLHHPGIAQIYDYGEVTADGQVTPYIVMQHVEGTSLWQVLRERRTLPPIAVMDLVAQVAAALQVAHEAGIVHRDLKPANMILTPEGAVVLVDFGIARSADLEPLTMTGTLVGTADYISPEQSEGRTATSRSDLYALGMVAYECLTGHKPFRRETDIATALAHLREEAPPLPAELPSGVRSLVGQLIRKDPSERPADAAEVERRALALARPDGPLVSPAAASATSATSSATFLDTTLTSVLHRPALRLGPAALRLRHAAARSRRVYVAAAVLLAAVAGSFFVAARPAVTRVPDLRGHSVAAAMRTLDQKGIDAEQRVVDAPDGRRGTVLRQKPAPGTTAGDDTVVVLVVASGRTNLAADDVLGETYQEAARHLVELGLVPARAIGQNPGGAVVGSVIAVDPAGRLPLGSTVTLTLAAAPGVAGAPVVDQGPSAHVKPRPHKASHKAPPKPHGHGKGHGRH